MIPLSVFLDLYFMRCRNPACAELIISRFLLARFHMDSLVTKTKRKDVRNALETLPPELDGSYDQTMERIESQGKDYLELARRVLLWVSTAFRPLSPVELQYAIAVQPGMTELDDEDLDDQDLMISVSAGLVVLDPETNTLRFVRKCILFLISKTATQGLIIRLLHGLLKTKQRYAHQSSIRSSGLTSTKFFPLMFVFLESDA